MQSLEPISSKPRPKSFETETWGIRDRDSKKTGLETRLESPSLQVRKYMNKFIEAWEEDILWPIHAWFRRLFSIEDAVVRW